MPFFLEAQEFVVLPAGMKRGNLYKVEVVEQAPFGQDPEKTKERIKRAVWSIRPDQEFIPEDILKRIMDENDSVITWESVDAQVYTGIRFGSKRATATKLARTLTGNPKLEPSDAVKIDWEKRFPIRVDYLLDIVTDNDGIERNKVAGIALSKSGKSLEDAAKELFPVEDDEPHAEEVPRAKK